MEEERKYSIEETVEMIQATLELDKIFSSPLKRESLVGGREYSTSHQILLNAFKKYVEKVPKNIGEKLEISRKVHNYLSNFYTASV